MQDHHYKRMEIEKKEKELEDMLHEYRVGKGEFEERREAIFNECARRVSWFHVCHHNSS